MKTLTIEQENKLLQAIAPDIDIAIFCLDVHPVQVCFPTTWKQRRNLLAALLMVDAGLRVGEVSKLIISDVFFQEKPVKTLQIRAEIAKRNHPREIPLPPRLLTYLSYTALSVSNFNDLNPDEPLITAKPMGKALSTRTIERFIKQASINALGFAVNPHMLRHTYATKLMKVTDIRTVQELLGHRRVTSTQIYTHVNDEDKRKAVSML